MGLSGQRTVKEGRRNKKTNGSEPKQLDKSWTCSHRSDQEHVCPLKRLLWILKLELPGTERKVWLLKRTNGAKPKFRQLNV